MYFIASATRELKKKKLHASFELSQIPWSKRRDNTEQ
jgi:hypothetical protein